MTDRELDALVAEKVMGWRIERYMTNPPKPTGMGMPPDSTTIAEIPAYSTDIAAAWEVVEKMRAQGFDNQFSWRADRPGHRSRPFACFGRNGSAEADTLQKAICLAALKAVGVKMDD